MQEDKIDLVKIEKLRRHRRRRRLAFIIALLVAACMVLAYFTGLYGASLSVLGDLVDTAAAAIDKGEGYPISFTLSGLSKVQPLAGGFAAVGESDLAIYSPSGKELRRLQHGYARPAIALSNTRVALYNRAGTELRIEGRSRNLFKKIFDQPIQLVEMSAGGSFAVVTRSARYEAELTVYNSLFEPSYFWYSAHDTPMAVNMSRDGRKVAIGCIRPDSGALTSCVYMLDIGLDEPVAQLQEANAMPLQLKYLDNGDLEIIYDKFVAVYSGKNGEELSRYSYGERVLQTGAMQEDYSGLVLTSENRSKDTEFVLLSDKLQELGSYPIGQRVNDICLTATCANLLTDTKVLTFGTDATLWGETAVEGKGVALIDAKQQLLFTRTKVLPFEPPTAPKPTKKSIFNK